MSSLRYGVVVMANRTAQEPEAPEGRHGYPSGSGAMEGIEQVHTLAPVEREVALFGRSDKHEAESGEGEMDTSAEVGHESQREPCGIVRGLAELPPQAHLDGAALGSILGRCKKSVQRAVRRGELPPPFRFMGKHVWLVKTLVEHLEEQQAAALNEARRLDGLRNRYGS